MSLPEIFRASVAIAVSAVLAIAAVSDVRQRRIPNWTVAAILGLFVVWTTTNQGGGWSQALVAGGVAAVVSVSLYAAGVVGAGDSKLFTVVALFAGTTYLAFFGLATVMAGGVIAAVSLAARPTRALVMLQLRGKGDFGRGVPYGVAIAIGGCLAVWCALSGVKSPV